MAETLTPADGTEVINTTEDVGASVTFTSSLAVVESWDWDIAGIGAAPSNPPEFVVTDQGDSLLLEYEPSPALFPLQYVDYQDDAGQRVRVTGTDAWDQVPPPDDAPEILKMQEDDKDLLEWTASVTATGLDDEGQPATASGSYPITVFANYDQSRDLLTDAVDERR